MSLVKSYLDHRRKTNEKRENEGGNHLDERKTITHPYNIEVEETIIDGAWR